MNVGPYPCPKKTFLLNCLETLYLDTESSGNIEEFLKVDCPKCGKEARRETDTMDTFMDSSWYFLRYTDALNDDQPFAKHIADHWMQVDFYCGGIEHAQMHLIYARFMTKALRDLGLTSVDEPFNELLCQGMVNKSAPFANRAASPSPPPTKEALVLIAEMNLAPVRPR